MYVELWTRNFAGKLNTEARLGVAWHRWAAIGGPESAQIGVEGSESAVLDALSWLRLPVTIYADSGMALWWGYVERVTAQAGAWQFGLGLDEMMNSVAVRYTDSSTGTLSTTSFATETLSSGEYGLKEHIELLSQDRATLAEAEQLRDRILADAAYPIPQRQRVGPGRAGATLFCRGWWATLDWRFWAQVSTGTVETTTQISNIIIGEGEFVTATDVINTAGINGYQERDGTRTARENIEELLTTGTTNDRRLLGTVTQGRRLVVYEEPARTSVGYYLHRDGRVTVAPLGTRLEDGLCPVGAWAADVDVLPGSVDLSYLGAVSPLFIERCEWRAGALFPEERGVESAWARLGG